MDCSLDSEKKLISRINFNNRITNEITIEILENCFFMTSWNKNE